MGEWWLIIINRVCNQISADWFQNMLSKSSINQLGSKRADWDVTDTGMPWSNDDPWQVVTVEWWGSIVVIPLLMSHNFADFPSKNFTTFEHNNVDQWGGENF